MDDGGPGKGPEGRKGLSGRSGRGGRDGLAPALLADADARRDRPVFPDAIQSRRWRLEDDLGWDVREHQWHSEHARPACEHPEWETIRARVVSEGRFDLVWVRTWADAEAVRQGCWFDERAGEKAANFFRLLRHTKAPFAKRPFVLLPWQRFDVVMPLFGWKKADGTRRFAKGYIEIPKKNGKSTLCSGISLYLLVGDGEAGAEVYNIASDIAQASIVFREAMRMGQGSPYLKPILTVKESVKTIDFPLENGLYKVLSSDVGTKEGLNISGLIFDELHAQKSRDLFDALEYGGSARLQAILVAITTAGQYDPLSIGWEEHEYARRNLQGQPGPGEDTTYFAYIRTIVESEKKIEWQDPYWWYRSNPGLGVTLPFDKFEQNALTAKHTPSKQNSFKRYRVNIWVQAATAAFRIEDWDACYCKDMPELVGMPCWAGLDLSATTDITAASLAFPPREDKGLWYLKNFFWLPEENLAALGNKARAPYEMWAERGYLRLTPGNIIDLEQIRDELIEINRLYRVKSWRFDPWRAVGLTTELMNKHRFRMVEFGQTHGWMNSPTTEFENLLITHRLRHDGNPVMGWMMGNCQFDFDAKDQKRIVKTRKQERFKVDGPVSTVMAIDGGLRERGKVQRLGAESLVIGG